MRIFGMDIPDDKVPEGTFKRFMAEKSGDYEWSLTAPAYTQEEKDWINATLESRKRQLLARADKIRYEG